MLSTVRRASRCQSRVRYVYRWHSARGLHDAKDSTSSAVQSEAKQEETSKRESLLDELFPEVTKPTEKRPGARRHIPRLELPVDIVPGNGERLDRWWKRFQTHDRKRKGPEPIGLIERYVEASREHKPHPKEGSYRTMKYPTRKKCPPEYQEKSARLSNGQEVALLVLHNASTSLTETDFRRIVPRGKHIKEWRSEGEILEIIPGRDPDTLTPLGNYFLLFASYSSAIAYRNEASRLHWLARKFTPTSLTSPIPPPPGYVVDGEDIHAALQSYTLLPPSQKLVLNVMYPPFSSSIQKILDQGGYTRLVNRNVQSKNAVRFRVDGLQLPLHVVQKTIERDGRYHRPLPWRLIQQGAISALDDGAMTFTSEEEEYEEDEEEEEEEDEVGKASDGRQNGVKIRRGETRCIIMFEDSDEARRFVRAWNKRPFPLSSKTSFRGRMMPLVDVELLW